MGHRTFASIHVRILLALIAASTTLVSAADDKKTTEGNAVPFDHAKDAPSKSFRRDLKPGETLTIMITNTATNCFDYPIEKVAAAAHAQAGPPTGIGEVEQSVTITHDEAYGGYIVHVTRKTENLPPACSQGNVGKLQDAKIMVIVDTDLVEVAFGGAFTVSSLTDRVYAARADAITGEDLVFRDKDAEDAESLGVAAMIHVYGKRWPAWVPSATFGLGITDSTQATYYAGPFWRLGKQMFLGFGLAFGAVDHLPAGVREGDVVTDANLLANLTPRMDHAGFIGFSYTFLGGKAAFEKPFQSVSSSSPAAAPPAAAPPVPAAANPATNTGCTAANVAVTFEAPGSPVAPGPVKIKGKLTCAPTDHQGLAITLVDSVGGPVGSRLTGNPGVGDFETTWNLTTAGDYVLKVEIEGSGATIPAGTLSFSVR